MPKVHGAEKVVDPSLMPEPQVRKEGFLSPYYDYLNLSPSHKA